MTSRPTQWNPCGLQGRSVGISQSTGLDCDDFLFSIAYFVFSVTSYSADGSKEAMQVGVDVMFAVFVALVTFHSDAAASHHCLV